MEIFAQWLDDLDDLVLALPLIWGSTRRRCVELGLLAALGLVGASVAVSPAGVVVGASTFAVACVSAWLAAFVAAILHRPVARSA
jgi:hypothetical protein